MEERNKGNNLYRAPDAEVASEADGEEAPLFYVVSPAKFSLLFWSTMGLYDLYWQFKNWSRYREARGVGDVPVLRALLSIFYAPPLFLRMKKEARGAGVIGGVPALLLAVVYVVCSLFSNLSGLSDEPGTKGLGLKLLGLACLLPIWWALLQCQKRVNATVGDPSGRANHRLTEGNWFWIVLGALLWLFNLISLATWAAALGGVVRG
tara:strand:+ start:176 stop:796 length:621 start_codon:yes stop_codon:yes gene_type:complete